MYVAVGEFESSAEPSVFAEGGFTIAGGLHFSDIDGEGSLLPAVMDMLTGEIVSDESEAER